MSKYVYLNIMIEDFFKIVNKFPYVFFGSLVPVLAFSIAIFRKKYFTKSTQALFYFVLFFILSDIPLWVTTIYKLNNLLYGFSRDSVNLILLASIYSIGLKNKTEKKALFSAILIMVLAFVLQLVKIIPIGEYLWISKMLLGGISIYYFFKLLQNPVIQDILNFPFFWFNSGVLFYCLSTLMITFFYKFTTYVKIELTLYFKFIMILEYLSVVMFLFFAYSFWTSKKNIELKKR
jgi:hypothetical protein